MRSAPGSRLVGAMALVCALVGRGASHADPLDASPVPDEAVVARVGSRVITARALEARLAKVPAFQLETLGTTQAEARRTFLETVMVPEVLLTAAAEDRGIARALPVGYALDRTRSSATLREVRRKVGPASSVAQADVQAYYDAHRDQFDTPERVQVWRILLPNREEGEKMRAALEADGTVQSWRDKARDSSLDKATSLRAGNLGFLDAEGVSNEAGLRVDPAVAKVAFALKDGETAGALVPEAGGFGVVSRRAHLDRRVRTVTQAASQIRDLVRRAREQAADAALLVELRATQLHELHPELVSQIELPALEGAVQPARPPSTSASHE